MAPLVPVTASATPARHGRVRLVPSACVNRHSGIEKINASIFGLLYSHKRHLVDAGLTCTRCHSNQRRHGELIVQRQDCLGCDHSQKERDCGYCHSTQEAILKGQSDSLALQSPDVMIAAEVTCRNCHE